ncbi:MAG: hypothetical protein AAGC58_12600 [Asticcacaulis sp.]
MMERPNTVAGLMAKRDELIKLRKSLEAEIYKVTCDVDHLDAAIALFDPKNTPAAIKRYAIKHRAKKGTVQQFVMKYLREATEPVTSRDITEGWVEARGLRADQETFVILRKRIGATLTKYRGQGIIQAVGDIDGYRAWVLTTAFKSMPPKSLSRLNTVHKAYTGLG